MKDMDTVRELINSTSDPSLLQATSKAQETPLDLAARLGHNKCFRWMFGALRRQLPREVAHVKPGIAFTCARYDNSALLVELLQGEDGATGWRNQDFDDLVLFAARFGSSHSVDKLLSLRGANTFDPFVQNDLGDTPLHLAILANRFRSLFLSLVFLLLFVCACFRAFCRVSRLLFASPSSSVDSSPSRSGLSCSGETVQILLRHAARWSTIHGREALLVANSEGLSSVALAVRHGNVAIAEMILDEAGVLDPQDQEILLHLGAERCALLFFF